MYTTKQLVKISQRILDTLVKIRLHRYQELLRRLTNSQCQLEEIIETGHGLKLATDHQWLTAAEQGRERMSRNLYALSNHLGELSLISRAPVPSLPTLRLVFDELAQLQDEFDDFNYDFKTHTLSVDTEAIELEDIYLGTFSIQLDTDKLCRYAAGAGYRVVAQDPHPACTREEVTHPHVSSDQLCEGDGAAAINAALQEGRLVDFFTLVSNILKTYNQDSAYVKLESWNDAGCYECGTEISEDEVYYCQACNREFCDGCSSCCHSCDTTMCLNCLDRCPVCDERICSDCLKTCKRCKKTACLNCMDDVNTLICPECQDQNKESEEDQDDESNSNHECDCETCRAHRQGTCHCQTGGDEDRSEAETSPATAAI